MAQLPKRRKQVEDFVDHDNQQPARPDYASPSKSRGTLEKSDGEHGQRVAAALTARGTPGELVPENMGMPQAPQLPRDQLPEAARARLEGRAGPPTLADVRKYSNAPGVQMSPHAQRLAEQLGVMKEAEREQPKDAETPAPTRKESVSSPEGVDESKVDAAEDEIADQAIIQALINQQALNRDPLQAMLTAPERRAAIEAKLDPLDIGELISKGYVTQRIPITKGYVIELRSLQQFEYLFCLDYVSRQEGSRAYLEQLYNTVLQALSIRKVGATVYPPHTKGEGLEIMVDDDAFDKKLQNVLSQSQFVSVDISVQYVWFAERVAKLFGVEAIKNG